MRPGTPALHAARGIHGVAPKVIAEPALADHAGDQRASVDADADLERLAVRAQYMGGFGDHFEGEVCNRFNVPGPSIRHAAGHHVGVAYRLDLLDAVPLDQLVELAEHPVQEFHDLCRCAVPRSR